MVDFDDGRGARYEKRRNGANVFIMSKKEEKGKLAWQRVLNNSLKKKKNVWYVDAQKRLFICVAKFVVVAVFAWIFWNQSIGFNATSRRPLRASKDSVSLSAARSSFQRFSAGASSPFFNVVS
jgi:hypothetical protein